MPSLYEIVARVGGEVRSGGTEASVPGPGHSRKDRSLSLRLEGDRVVWFSHAGDLRHGDVMAYLGLDQREERPQSRAERERRERERQAAAMVKEREGLAFCQEVWAGSQPLAGSPADGYLRSRGLDLTGCIDLRFHPAAPRNKPRVQGDARPDLPPHPALLALVRDVTGAPRGLHATYVRADGGGKAFGDKSRLMFGPVREGAVRLAPPDSRGRLAVGEGIETTASYSRLFGLPGWASLSTAGMKTLRIPAGVHALAIAADNDDGGAGLEAANMLAERVRCEAEVHEAPFGADWGDVWEAQRHVA